MAILIAIWGLLRYLFALAGLVLLALAILTLLDVFTVSVEGEQVAWYWLLIAAFVIGGIGQMGDFLIEKSVGIR